MEASFVPFNANQSKLPSAQILPAMPLHPPAKAMEMPDDDKAMLLPDDSRPKTFNRSFKDIYLDKREELRKSSEGMESIELISSRESV